MRFMGHIHAHKPNNNISIMEIPGVEKEKGIDSVFKAITAENFPKVGREMSIQIHEA